MEVNMPSRCLCKLSALAIFIVIGLLGCSGGGSGPTMPGVTGTDAEISPLTSGQADNPGDNAGRYLWGLWNFHVNDDHTAIEVEPLRDATFHLNITGYLENPPGTQNLRIVGVSWTEFDTLEVDIQLIHPLGSNKTFTGRDVRGIAILPWTRIFPSTTFESNKGPFAHQLQQIYASRWLLNADGYTTLWNRLTSDAVEFPKIFGYIRGKLASADEYFIDSNLNGFRNFYTDPIQHVFQNNQAVTRSYEFDFPPGPLTFAYAVDCSWEMPTTLPVTDIWAHFPITANCPEPFQISTTVVSNTLTKIGGNAVLEFDVKDWQDATNFSHVHVEAPDLFFGTIDLTGVGPISYPDSQTARYQVTVPNTKGNAVTAEGGSDLLIVVEDVDNSTVNPDLTAYNIYKLPVADVEGFWRDRNGDGSFVNVPLVAPLIEPSSLSDGTPDLTVVSYPEDECDFFNGQPEIMLFDDNDSRYIVYNRELNATYPKAGYPFDFPPSWLNYPTCMDATVAGWFGAGSTNTTGVGGNYQVKHILNIFDPCGIYGFSWHTGTDDGSGDAMLEILRDVTSGMGNVAGDPIFGLFTYENGTGPVPDRAHILSCAAPYIDPGSANTFRTYVPLSNAGYLAGAINPDADIMNCSVDTDPVGLDPLHWAFYTTETNTSAYQSEIEVFDINFMNFDPAALLTIDNSDIQAEFPGAVVIDCEVVPSLTKHVTIIGETTAQYNWLAVLMTDGTNYWTAFYDPLNPHPDNSGNLPDRSIYTSTVHPLPPGTTPVAMDVDHQYFEVYVLLWDSALDDYYATVFEFFY